jgi:bacterioferritin-associated ferredoxin
VENDLLEEISRSICANIDEGTACDDVCGVCRRQANEVLLFMSMAQDAQMKRRIKALECMLLEVLEIAVQHEEGDYVRRAQDVLFDTQPSLKLVKGAPSV